MATIPRARTLACLASRKEAGMTLYTLSGSSRTERIVRIIALMVLLGIGYFLGI
jgi:hypothetical protein